MNVAIFAPRKHGQVGRIWTHGFDKRFCFNQDNLNQRIEYVKKHQSD